MTATKPSTAGLSPWEIHPDDFPADGGADQKLLFMLNFAILAPSFRNVQPWLFRLQGHEVELVIDRKRSLPIVDPLDRELIMSCGAALHHLRVAARYFGCELRTELFPDPTDSNILARISLGLTCENTAHDMLLFEAIQQRRTHRFPFSPDPIPPEALAEFELAILEEGCWVEHFSDEPSRVSIADLVAMADQIQWHDRAFRDELAACLTPNNSFRRDGIPGYARGQGDFAAYAEPLLVRNWDLGPRRAVQDRDMALQAPMLAIIGSDDDSPISWLRTGQAVSAFLLCAASEGISVSFLNQVTEVPETRASLSQLTNRGGATQILLRLGFGSKLKPTPRRALSQAMLKSKHTAIRISSLC